MSRMKTRLNSREWYGVDKDCVGGYFEELGFTRVGEILALRMFDLFNMDRIDNIRAWEMIRCLYVFLNENSDMDQALEWKLADQSFPFTEWRRAHKAKSVRVAGLVMAADMNEKALQRLFGNITRAFYKSNEYSARYYKYGSLDELKEADMEYQEVVA